MVPRVNIANQLLNIEQRLIAYQTLHENELEELWQALNECKRLLVAAYEEEDRVLVATRNREDENTD